MTNDLSRLIVKVPPPAAPDMSFVVVIILVAVIAFALGFAIARRIK